MSEPIWLVYLLECKGGVLYTGITPDVAARFEKHLSGKGAMFTRLNRPVRVIASKPFGTRSAASKAERMIKGLPRDRKLWIAAQWNSQSEVDVIDPSEHQTASN